MYNAAMKGRAMGNGSQERMHEVVRVTKATNIESLMNILQMLSQATTTVGPLPVSLYIDL